MRAIVPSSAILALLMGVAACTSADGEVTGGALRQGFDAAPPPKVVAEFPTASQTSWKGLYRDFFSPNAESGCARFPKCHGAPGKSFVCNNVDACYLSLRTDRVAGTVALVADSAIADPDTALLFRVIRLRTPDGKVEQNSDMPLEPSDFVFSADAIGRMKQWIRNGATNED